MASPSFAPKPLSQKRLSLAEIGAVVSASSGLHARPVTRSRPLSIGS
jgi:hypothetical protein